MAPVVSSALFSALPVANSAATRFNEHQPERLTGSAELVENRLGDALPLVVDVNIDIA